MLLNLGANMATCSMYNIIVIGTINPEPLEKVKERKTVDIWSEEFPSHHIILIINDYPIHYGLVYINMLYHHYPSVCHLFLTNTEKVQLLNYSSSSQRHMIP